MVDGLDWVGQEDFSAGAFPLQERVPVSAVEDCVNGLVAEDGSIFKRGGSAYKGNAAPTNQLAVWDAELAGGRRTFFTDLTTPYDFAADDATVSTIYTPPVNYFYAMRRIAVLNGLAVIPRRRTDVDGSTYTLWGGSRLTTYPFGYAVGTITVAEGSTDVVGVGTSWLANIDAGTLLLTPGGDHVAIAAVTSDTTLVLASPWPEASVAGAVYGTLKIRTWTFYSGGSGPRMAGTPYVAAVGNRLVAAAGNIVRFTAIGQTFAWDSTNYHALPIGAIVTGLQAVHETLWVFTTKGVYAISNMAYDLTDALGNVQQQLTPMNTDLLLWHDNGIVNWHGAVVVPATDNVYLIGGNGRSEAIGDQVRKLYRSYVAAGYTLGLATVIRGHYVLPVLNGTTWIDTLVCRLDMRAWSRASGYSGSCVSFASRVASDETRTEKLLGVNGTTRVVEGTGWLAPAAANKYEADGSTHNLQVTFRTVQRKTAKDLLRKVRARYELDDAAADNPTLTAAVAVGRPGSAFTNLSGAAPENVGQTPYTWKNVNVRGQEVRVRLTSSGPSASLVVRSVEYGFRPTGRQ